MAFSFLGYLLSFLRYSRFCSKIDGVSTIKINHKIKNISGKIGVMLLKLGTNKYGSQVRHKMTPTVLLPW